MMKKHLKITLALLLALAMVFSLAACAKQAPTPSAAPAEEPSPTPEAAPAEPTPDPDTPAGRAAARGLPAPPDIDIADREYIVNNSYNSITEYDLSIENRYSGVGGQGADVDAAPAVQELMAAARAAGLEIYIAAGYRNYEWLLNNYSSHVYELGMGAEVAKVFLGPGVNEHQTGFAFDFTDDASLSGSYYEFDDSDVVNSELYAWLCEHCAEYGFILRYPEGKEEYYGTACNSPAHFRYVGTEAAAYIMENDLCFEEFLLLYDPDAVFVPEHTDP